MFSDTFHKILLHKSDWSKKDKLWHKIITHVKKLKNATPTMLYQKT